MAAIQPVEPNDPNAHTAQLTVEEQNGLLVAAAAPLIDAGFRAQIFDATVAANLGYTHASTIKQVKFAGTLATNDLMREAINAGISAGVMQTQPYCTLSDFMSWTKWMKSPPGRSALYKAQQDKKLQKKMTEGISATDMAIVKCFNHMKQVFANEKKACTQKREKRIEELRTELRHEERALKSELAEIAVKYLPVAEYQEPDERDINNLAYKLYSDDAVLRGRAPIIRVAGGLEEALRSFGATAREILERNHAVQQQYRPALMSFMSSQLFRFRESADERGFQGQKHLMVTIFGSATVEETIAAEDQACRRRADREARAAEPRAHQNPPVPRAPRAPARRNPNRGSPVRTRSRSGNRENQPELSDTAQSSAQSVGQILRGDPEVDPHGEE
ncbi:TPA_asm: hypothetical protein [Epimedium pseudowushanense amalgavirus 1]|nr:TPA_asm: hypothetical protein [Epimedium pseudowushanense amalgavirus 1]